mmetsp:Transcript_22094/g.46600  ORF Transcript_22094/g.46600 Transcript_22094/m.46600 type:complete len:1058 (+) Transcript_22094:244-3417(+)|eukprot:CAMPEP_0183721946 /NCGR_PEP_ID=MMETSP0737-20130205/14048_1 /TAXON_ID=385413 /ORGANISM="Thalassiosira miniscula, Strain CCMP1093" /LENGTH=1057 /DNA_ID=CAMNT_0025952017 /DNA_START=200 /DNA_END=3373 /DNA_ORIENTATION=+
MMASSNTSDGTADATSHHTLAASSDPLSSDASMPIDSAQRSYHVSARATESASMNSTRKRTMATTQKAADDGHSKIRMKTHGDSSELDGHGFSLHPPQSGSVQTTALHSTPLDKNASAFSAELDNIFDNFDNFGQSEREHDESDVFANLSSNPMDDPRKMRNQEEQTTEEQSVTATVMSTASAAQDNSESSQAHEVASLKPAAITATSRIPTQTQHRNSSISRRRASRQFHQMERITEVVSPNGITEEAKDNNIGAFEDSPNNEFVEDFFVQGTVSEHSHPSNNSENDSNDEANSFHPSDGRDSSISAIATTTTTDTLPLLSTTRRRVRSSGGSVGGSIGGNSIDGRSTGSGTRLRRGRIRRLERSTRSVDGERGGNNNGRDSERMRQLSSSGNPLVASLDAGMASLRRWIRVRRLSLGSGASGAGAGGSSSGQQSVSSMTTMRLGEEDIFALSRTGSNQRRVATMASTSSDPNNLNIFEPDGNTNGFLYYRPFEVHVNNNDIDADSGFYGSDDESRTSNSILLYPLVPSTESGSVEEGGSDGQARQRAYSEPDRARIIDFFSSIYGSRAIDGGPAQGGTVAATVGGRSERSGTPRRPTRHRSSTVPTSTIIEEETDTTEQDNQHIGESLDTEHVIESNRIESMSPLERELEVPEATAAQSSSALSRDSAEVTPVETLESDAISNNELVDDPNPNTSTRSASDPNRRARIRWMRINRRFRCLVTSVAVLFSLLLFCIVIAWVLLTSTYVLSHNKECDVPLKAYFWMVSLQLILDIFRADIMRWLCRHETDSGRRLPPRVIMYNVAYLIYAMLVLRLGVRSVFITESTCSSTAPELFYASLIFVCLSMMAWAIILLGYLIPFCFVAILLTRNGYFPNGDIASSRGVMGGRRARIGTGRISGFVGEVFPNTCSNPAPPGTADRLRMVLLHELPDSYQKECCICMMEYKDGEVIVATPCEHIFHKRCCQEWLQLSRTCPVCRKDLPDALGMNEGADGEMRGNIGESISESDEEMQGQNNGPRGTPNFVQFLRRERRQTTGDTSNHHPEGIAVIDLTETAA